MATSAPPPFSPATAAAIASETQPYFPRTLVESPTPLSANSSASGRSPSSSARGSEPYLGTPRSKLSQESLTGAESGTKTSSRRRDMTDSAESETRKTRAEGKSETVSSAFGDDEVQGQKTSGFKIGFAEDKNKKHRRTMEDAHSYFYNFGKRSGAGWFAIYDGHAGRSAADYCGAHLHENFETLYQKAEPSSIPSLLNETFMMTDTQIAERKASYSGCTAVVGYIQTEERPPASSDGEANCGKRRVLYTANVGDARAVLSRGGKAIRLSYDHKGSDPAEAKRIVETGGFVMNNRVNGVLAVTRSLGDTSMKEWVIGSPYTTETVLGLEDSFLIFACDGVWDVCSDQAAVDLIRDTSDPQQAAEDLLDHALENFSTDNLSVMVVRLEQPYVP